MPFRTSAVATPSASRRLLPVLLACAALIALASGGAADSTAPMGATLPTPRNQTSAVWDGTHAYIFGGISYAAPTGKLVQIVRYDPATDVATVMGATLPTARSSTSAVWDGTYAYVFGGFPDGLADPGILRYDPATDTVTAMTATLGTRGATAAVWTGTHAYIFGGAETASVDDIVRYDPATDTATTMGATLPSPRNSASAAWVGSSAYVFGGADESGLTEIVRYDPDTDTVTTMAATVPEAASYYASAFSDGTYAYILGADSRVYRYDPAADEILAMPSVLATAPMDSSVAWTGTDAYVFAGNFGDDILRYTPGPPPVPPSEPLSVLATAGPGLFEIMVCWGLPADDGGWPAVPTFSVYRDSGSGWAWLADVGHDTCFIDTELAPLGAYSYRVTAANPGGEGSPSATTCSRPLPVGLVVPC
jgi:hypothetical protein